MPRESTFIDWLERQPQRLVSEIVRGIGDDAAIVNPQGPIALSQDLLIEDVHFRANWISPWLLGCKALRVNLSDLAAMAARPLASLLSLGLPRDRAEGIFQPFMEGFLEETRRFACPLIGGDLSAAPCLTVSVTVLGKTEDRALFRDGARPGDKVAIVGPLGASGRALRLLGEREFPGLTEVQSRHDLEQLANPLEAGWLSAHFLPEPQLESAGWLRRRGVASSMMDLSDGLVPDLQKLARASCLGAVLDADALRAERGEAVAASDLDIMLQGGEDYSLLFTFAPDQEGRLRAEYPIELPPWRVVGSLEPGDPEVWLRDQSGLRMVPPEGFEHFS